MISSVARVMSVVAKVIIGLGIALILFLIIGSLITSTMDIGNVIFMSVFVAIFFFLLWGSTITIESFLWKFSDRLENKPIPIKILAIIATIPIGIIWFTIQLIISIFSKEARSQTFTRKSSGTFYNKSTHTKLGFIEDGKVYRGNNYDRIGFIEDDKIYRGHNYDQIGYIRDGNVYRSSNNERIGSVEEGAVLSLLLQ